MIGGCLIGDLWVLVGCLEGAFGCFVVAWWVLGGCLVGAWTNVAKFPPIC